MRRLPGTLAARVDGFTRDDRGLPWRVGLLAMVVSLLHAAPPYDVRFSNYPLSTRVKGLHPLTHLAYLANGDPRSHEAKLDYRFVVPLLLRPFNGSFVAAAVFFAVCGVIAFAVLTLMLRDGGVPPRTAALAVVSMAVTPAATVFTLGLDYFDAMAIALALGALWVSRQWAAGVLAVTALYTDERALVALVLGVVAQRWLGSRRGAAPVTLAVAVGVYAATRVALEVSTDLRTARAGVGPSVLAENIERWPIGIAFAFGAWWVLFGAGVFVATKQGRPWGLIAAAGFAGAVVSVVVVDDVTRSAAYLLPLVPLVVVALWRRTPARIDRWLTVALVAGLVVPVVTMNGPIGRHSPLPVHVARWVGLG